MKYVTRRYAQVRNKRESHITAVGQYFPNIRAPGFNSSMPFLAYKPFVPKKKPKFKLSHQSQKKMSLSTNPTPKPFISKKKPKS